MFGKHALELRIKKDDTATTPPKKPLVTTEDIPRIAKQVVTYVAVGVMGTLAAASILNTASEITVHKFTTEPDKES